MKKIVFLFTALFLLFTSVVKAQETAVLDRHPKVIEMEMNLSKEATAFVQSRVGSGPVFVTVTIDPLRRAAGSKSEQLPYFYSEDDVADEWDAIDAPMALLLSRIKHAEVKVEVPSTVSENEIADIREKLFKHLKLVPVRDTISIDIKAPIAKKDNFEAKEYIPYYSL